MAKAVPGTLKVSNDCIADLAGYAAMECYGVVGMAVTDTQNGVMHLLPAQRLRKGIDVSYEGSTVVVDLHVVLEQGVNMASVSKNLEDFVKFLLKKIAEFDDVKVRVHVEGMRKS
jgi:uncharacterized alkaline shock family protein YloU